MKGMSYSKKNKLIKRLVSRAADISLIVIYSGGLAIASEIPYAIQESPRAAKDKSRSIMASAMNSSEDAFTEKNQRCLSIGLDSK